MKPITKPILAIILLGLCAAPLARAEDTSGVEAKLKSMEDSWSAAQLEKDRGASVIDGLIASDFSGIDPRGKIRNKEQTLERLRKETDTYTASKNDNMEVHVYGPNIATVVGTSSEKGKDKNGKEFSRSYAWTDTWMERDGKWQCIAEGVTELPNKK